MLELTITGKEFYDAASNRFLETPSCTLTLEHSLISLAKWESKWLIPYFDGNKKTHEQDMDYIRCMVIGPIKDNTIFDKFSNNELIHIQNYIQSPMTATTFSEQKNVPKKRKKDVMTAEVIYARMFMHRVSLDCQKWHLNRLLALLKVCDLQNVPAEKMSKKQATMWAAEQNAARQAKYNTRG